MTNTTNTAFYQLPVHWAPALINDDWSGLEEHDEEQIMSFLFNELAGEGVCITLDSDQEAFFMKHHDAYLYGCKACDCYNYTVIDMA